MSTVKITAAELLPMIEDAEKGMLKAASKHVCQTVRVVASRGWFRNSYMVLRKGEETLLKEAEEYLNSYIVQPYYGDRKTLQGLRVLCTMSDTIDLSTEDALVLDRYS